MGPVAGYWSYAMERWCGYLGRAVQSRRYPYANIANYATAAARLHTIKIVYGLDDKLMYSTQDILTKRKKAYVDCEPFLPH